MSMIYNSPQAKMISTEVQCCLMSDPSQNHLEEQLDETQKTNTNLARELGTAKKEINFLKSRLQELEVCAYNINQFMLIKATQSG